jgi:hypothetical protein
MNARTKYFVFIFILGPTVLLGQTLRNVTKDPASYKSEIANLLTEADKKATKSFIEVQWETNINAESFNAEQWEIIYNLTDFMLKKRIRAIPYFQQFAELLTLKPIDPLVDKEFNDILLSLVLVAKKNQSRAFQDYLETVYNLFTSGVFYSTPTLSWWAGKKNMSFIIEDDQPVVEFKNVDLKCYSKGDSSIIYQTSGMYYPLKGKWIGKKGKVDWQRAGLNKNDVYAELIYYDIALKSASYRADSILFHHFLFEKPLMGRIDEKILANVTPQKAQYPRFTSYAKRFEIPNIVDNVDFSGGFTMKGANFNGYGTPENPARLYFKYKGSTKVEVIADFITITESTLGATDAKVIIYLAADSIVHPSLNAKFVKSTRLLTLFRTGKGLEKAAFHDTYHNFDIYAESFKWNIDDQIIDIGAIFGSSTLQATLESVDYFSEQRYLQIMGLTGVHPLTSVKQLSKKLGTNTFTVLEFAKQIQMSKTQAEVLLINLSIDGFVDYNNNEKTATIKPKTDQYLLAFNGKVDYDVIEIFSNVSKGDNASIDLENNELTFEGIRFFTLSDSNNVIIYPTGGKVVIKKNRDLKFGGVVYAGKFEFFGSEYYFDYKEFTINLVNVDSARVKVPAFEANPDGYRPIHYVTNVIEGIRGTINVDDPGNKSGLKSKEFAHFPIFDCVKESYVYYDYNRIYDGVYNRENFYYEIPPFKIDSLEKFNTEDLSFDGRFVSAGIFEDIYEPLVIMPDYSLGFDRNLPEGGVGIYDDIANFDNEISLSGKGLQGTGVLGFFTSKSTSEGFTFFPDSTTGFTTSFVNTERSQPPEVPEAHAEEVFIEFYPYHNLLLANAYAEPISMYNGQASLRKGNLALSTDEMGGEGVIEFSGAFLESNDFVYSKDVFDADTSSFRLSSITESGMAFKTEDVSAHVDFINRVGEFFANGEESFVEFPSNQYICFMDQFKWYMDNNDIELESKRGENIVESDFVIDTDVNKSSSNFFSIREDQDSLNFLAPKAIFNINNSLIKCNEVSFIKVADARIYPDSGKVTIRKRAVIDKLLGAGVVTNDITMYHNIYNADLEIRTRFNYSGAGFIDYIDETEQPHQVWLKKISVDTIFQTVAEGKIISDDDFMLSPYFEFQGDVALEANRQFLVFDGNTRISHDCPDVNRYWFPFRAEVDPNGIRIPIVSDIKSNTNKDLASGIVTSSDPFGLYPVFLSAKKENSDQVMANVSGFITYDKTYNEYQIASQEKLLQRKSPGNFVAMNVNSCHVKTDGEINLNTKFNPMKFQLFGTGIYDAQKGNFNFNTSMTVDFHFNDEGLKLFTTDINQSPKTKGINFKTSYYEQSIKELLGQEKADKVITDLNLTGAIRKLPTELQKTIYIATVKLYWDDAAEAYKSKGLIGIANIEDKQVFKAVEGKIMITKKRSGDRIDLYFELDEKKWYYFSYSRGIMEAYSANKAFNATITDSKDDKRMMKGDKDTPDYEYLIGSRRKKDAFLDRFEE